jgi:hypothetical protein
MRSMSSQWARVSAVILLSSTALACAAPRRFAPDYAFGRWISAEQFENEPRISVRLRDADRTIEGWALLLGQHRKGDNGATLGLSFMDAAWTGQGVRFNTILPEDEGTIGWELRDTSPTTATLAALTEDGQPMAGDLRWEMRKD